MDTDLLYVILRPRCRALWVLVRWSRASFRIILGCVSLCVCMCVCLQTLFPPGPKKGLGFFSVPGSPSLRAVSGVNRLAPAVPRYPCPGSGHSKLDGCHEALPGCARPLGSGSGDGRRVPVATRAGRAPRAVGRGPGRRARLPGGWAAATRQGRRVLLPAGQRLAWPWGFVTALVPVLKAPERRVPGGHCAQGSPTPARPSCERLWVPAGAPGPAWRAGPDPPWLRNGRGVGAGSLRGPCGGPAGRSWGLANPRGVSGTRWRSECPPRALRPAPGAG